MTIELYLIVKSFPADERYRLVDQICRAVASVGANIAEGNERLSKKDKKHFLVIAKASVCEVEQHLWLAKDLGYISEAQLQNLTVKIVSISKQLGGWIKVL